MKNEIIEFFRFPLQKIRDQCQRGNVDHNEYVPQDKKGRGAE